MSAPAALSSLDALDAETTVVADVGLGVGPEPNSQVLFVQQLPPTLR